MKQSLITLIVIGTTLSAIGQGAWNIGYTPIHQLDTSYLGQEIRLDFKHDFTNEPFVMLDHPDQECVRCFVTPQDSAVITFGGKEHQIMERRKIYTDHGVIQEQDLIIYPYEITKYFYIKETFITDVTESQLICDIYVRGRHTLKKAPPERIPKIYHKVAIPRDHLDGIMYKL